MAAAGGSRQYIIGLASNRDGVAGNSTFTITDGYSHHYLIITGPRVVAEVPLAALMLARV